MEKNQVTSEAQLFDNGWKFITDYANYQVWGKENFRILLETTTSIVYLIYKKS